jgi:hypothetical protein
VSAYTVGSHIVYNCIDIIDHFGSVSQVLKIETPIKLLSVCLIKVFRSIAGCCLVGLFIVAGKFVLVGRILGCRGLLENIFNRYMKAAFWVMFHTLI